MPFKNKPGCRCCGDPNNCCTGTKPSFIDITVSGVTGTCPAPACVNARHTCSTVWNGTHRLTYYDNTYQCGASLVEFVDDICNGEFNPSCGTATRFWQWHIVWDGSSWIQRLTVQVFSIFQAVTDELVYEFDHGPTVPTCAAIDIDRALVQIADNSNCCNFGSATFSSTRIA